MDSHMSRQMVCTTAMQLQLAEIIVQNLISWRPISTHIEQRAILAIHLSMATTANATEMVPVMWMLSGTISSKTMSMPMDLDLSMISILFKNSISESILMKTLAEISLHI